MTKAVKLEAPAYQVPLNGEELALFGYFSAIWGQLDYWTGLTIAALLKTEIGAAETFMEGMTTGPRINFLRRLIPLLPDDDTQKSAKDFCTAMGGLIEKRNHLLHGLWGWSGKTSDDDTYHAASYYAKRKDDPIFASELVDLCNKASKQTYVIVSVQRQAFGLKMELTPGERSPAFFFGPKLPPGWPAAPDVKS